MDTVTFRTRVSDEQTIHAPAGINMPQGEVEVTVRQLPIPVSEDRMAATREYLLRFATEAEDLSAGGPVLPGDLAENHDHYASGKPKP